MQLKINHPTTETEIDALLQRLSMDVKAVLGEQFIGIYIHGSLALGDFNPESSDIDFLVLTRGELTEGAMVELEAMHHRIVEESSSRWPKRLEGSYVSQQKIKLQNPPKDSRLYTHGGKVSQEVYGREWVLEKHVLWEHGISLTGPPIQIFFEPIQKNEIQKAVCSLLEDWWVPMLTDSTRLQSDEYQAYAIVTMCRILYALEHGSIVSKPMAANWAKKCVAQEWKEIIDIAQTWREGIRLNIVAEIKELICYTSKYSEKKKKQRKMNT